MERKIIKLLKFEYFPDIHGKSPYPDLASVGPTQIYPFKQKNNLQNRSTMDRAIGEHT